MGLKHLLKMQPVPLQPPLAKRQRVLTVQIALERITSAWLTSERWVILKQQHYFLETEPTQSISSALLPGVDVVSLQLQFHPACGIYYFVVIY